MPARLIVAAVASLVVLGSCGPVTPGESTSSASSGGRPGTSTNPAEPAIAHDFPDPDVLEVDGTYYAYATNGNGHTVRMARSTDLSTWEELGDAMPRLPAWVIPGKTWAPEVIEVAPGRFALYFTATSFEAAVQCIGVATASSPQGPFEAVGDGMLVCPEKEGGAIDASTFLDDDGTRYLLWKNDGNCCGLDTVLQLAPLAPDGLSLAGPATALIHQDLPWEGSLIEAPTLVKRDGVYTLLYSANDYASEAYAVGYATAPSVGGPYTKDDEPLLSTSGNPRFQGPGGQDVVRAPDGTDRLIFHSWSPAHSYRVMNVVQLDWKDGRPTIPPD